MVGIASSDKFSQTNLLVKHFFSGAAAYIDNKIFCTYTPKGIAVKLSKVKRENLITSKKGAELRYFPKAPIKKDYVILNHEILANEEELNYWICEALKHVLKN